MTIPAAHPWFHEAVQLLDIRRQDRTLMVTAADPSYVQAVAELVGRRGAVLLVEPEREAAQSIAEVGFQRLEVLVLTPSGDETFGTFDALLCCPLAMPRWPDGCMGALALHNLRPGGRFVIDTPAEQMSEDLAACWEEIGGDPNDLQPLRGMSEQALTEELRAAGLRRVEAVLATHLLRLESAHELAELGGDALGADEDQRTELGRALAHRLRTTGAIDVLVHRTRVHGIR